jgi:hypothetical protein
VQDRSENHRIGKKHRMGFIPILLKFWRYKIAAAF